MLLEELLVALEEKDADKVKVAANNFARTCMYHSSAYKSSSNHKSTIDPMTLFYETLIGRLEDTLREAEEDFS
jgi:hypothetical protein